MKNKNIGFGVFLLSLGILWLLFNFKILDWSVLNALLTLWPLILVMIGINIVFGNNQIVKSLSWLAFLAVIIIYGYTNPSEIPDSRSVVTEAGSVSIDKEAQVKNGEIRLELGGIKLNIDGDTAKLFEASTNDPDIQHSVQYKDGKETADVKFSKKGNVNFITGSKTNYNFDLKLNKDIIWDMTLKVGAASGDFDFSELMVKNLDVDTGAASLDLIFGDRQPFTDIKIDSGASNIDVKVPENAGVRVKYDGGISSTNLRELDLVSKNGYYVSPNYDQASCKINLDVDMGVGKFNITRR